MRNKFAAFAAVLALSCPALATVLGNPPPTSYACNGTTTSFTVPWPYVASSHVVVNAITAAGGVTTLAATTDYTVKPSIAPTTGTVTLTAGSRCPAGSTLKISRVVPFTQPQSFRTGSYQGPVHEQAFDRLEMQLQQIGATAASATSSGLLSAADWQRFNATAFTSLNLFQATGTGSIQRSIGQKLADVVSVKDFGAVGDGISNDSAAFTSAIAAMTTAGGGTVYVPCGTYVLPGAISLTGNVSLVGQSRRCAVLAFTGATSGIVLPAGAERFSIENLTISTSNAGAAKAIDMSAGSTAGAGYFFFSIKSVRIEKTGAGRWATGLDARFAEVAEVIGLAIYQSATIGVYLADSSNQLQFYDLEITAGNATDLTFNRGIWVDANPSATAAPEFFGATSQGCFSLGSAVFVTGHHPKFYGLHAEGTCAEADGGDVVVNGTSDVSIFGAHISRELLVTGTVRGFMASGLDAAGAITFASTVQGAFIRDSRVTSITDNGTVNSATDNGNGWSNCRLTNGSALRNKGLVEFDSAGSGTASTATFPANGIASYPNGGIMYWRKAAGTSSGLLQLTAADQVFLRYPAASQITIGNDTPTSKITVTDTAVTLGAALPLTMSSVTFATLPASPVNGMLIFCSDCTIASPCASGGTGALAKRINATWVCN